MYFTPLRRVNVSFTSLRQIPMCCFFHFVTMSLRLGPGLLRRVFHLSTTLFKCLVLRHIYICRFFFSTTSLRCVKDVFRLFCDICIYVVPFTSLRRVYDVDLASFIGYKMWTTKTPHEFLWGHQVACRLQPLISRIPQKNFKKYQ